jgi:hypothetical protein
LPAPAFRSGQGRFHDQIRHAPRRTSKRVLPKVRLSDTIEFYTHSQRVSVSDLERTAAAAPSSRATRRPRPDKREVGGAIEDEESCVTQAAAFTGRYALDHWSTAIVTATLLIDCEEDRTLWAVLADRNSLPMKK